MTRSPAGPRSPGWTTRLLDRALARRLPGPRTDYRVERDLPVPTRDGVTLATDHYAPAARHTRGTILMRTPYGRGLLPALEARLYAGCGYHVVLQSCRGTFGSRGRFTPMAHEIDDAQDAVSWLRTQPWFDGRLATAGASYLGWTQWALLVDPPPELRTAVVTAGPHDMGLFAYGTGAFSLNDCLFWSEYIVNRERGVVRAVARAATATRRLAPVTVAQPLADALDRAVHHRAPWLREWLSHPDRTDPFWTRLDASDALRAASVPVRLVGGWQDMFLEHTVRQYEVLHERGVDVTLTIGPWTHLQTVLTATGRLARDNVRWLGEHLDGGPAPRARPPVLTYVTGADGWRELPQWPPHGTELAHYLHPGGRLAVHSPPGAAPPSSFTYDPRDPTPNVGGPLLTPNAGARDNRVLDGRSDVLTFTSQPLTSALEVIGRPVVELLHSRDNPHADVFVRLSDVDRSGRSRTFADANVRLDPASELATQQLRVRLTPCAHRLAPGHRLQLQVCGGAHPRYARNEGTDAPPGTGTDLRPCTHTVHHTPDAASRMLLPTPTP